MKIFIHTTSQQPKYQNSSLTHSHEVQFGIHNKDRVPNNNKGRAREIHKSLRNASRHAGA